MAKDYLGEDSDKSHRDSKKSFNDSENIKIYIDVTSMP
jgi:hypothetical protein